LPELTAVGRSKGHDGSLAQSGGNRVTSASLPKLSKHADRKMAKWWFGTFFIFPYIGNVIIPTDERIFFRGVKTNHQPGDFFATMSLIYQSCF